MTTPYREVATRECRGIAYLDDKRAPPWTPQHQAFRPPGGPGGREAPVDRNKNANFGFCASLKALYCSVSITQRIVVYVARTRFFIIITYLILSFSNCSDHLRCE